PERCNIKIRFKKVTDTSKHPVEVKWINNSRKSKEEVRRIESMMKIDILKPREVCDDNFTEEG
ncbi:hypothetical protein A2U01_0092574, partial [Trifolium medium]|nr:hypothetical protein [Trifolium medium]